MRSLLCITNRNHVVVYNIHYFFKNNNLTANIIDSDNNNITVITVNY